MIEIFEYLQHFQRQVEIFKGHVNTGISSSHNTGFAECLHLISQRTKEALSRKKAEGVILGRPKGKKSSPEKYKLHKKRNLIQELLNANISKRKIAVICKVDRNTLARYIKTFLADT